MTTSPFDQLQSQHAELLALLIFVARVVDVSLGTIRTILVVRGQRSLAAGVGFLEVTIWLLAVSSVVNAFDRPLNILGYAAGYAAGNYAGVWLEGKLALGEQVVRLFSHTRAREMADGLAAASFDSVQLDASNSKGPLGVLFVTAPRRLVPDVLRVAREIDPELTFTVEDLREPEQGFSRLPRMPWAWRFAPRKK